MSEITITITDIPDTPIAELVRSVQEHQLEVAGEAQPRLTLEQAARAWTCLHAVAMSLSGVVPLHLALTMMANGIDQPAPTPTSTAKPSDTQPSQPSVTSSPTTEQT